MVWETLQMIPFGKIFAGIGIFFLLLAGIFGGSWDTKTLAFIYAVANAIIFLK